MRGSFPGKDSGIRYTPPGNETDGTDELEKIYYTPDPREDDEASDVRSDS
jgi:hypothetical protein